MVESKRDIFIKRAIEIHGNKYIYNEVEYKNANTKVAIKCPEHGIFLMTPHDHLKGQGCKQCGLKKRSELRKMTQSQFVEKGNSIHNGKYIYSNVEYIDYKKEVIITCPIHGDFKQKPCDHLQGCGCPCCAKETTKSKLRLTTDKFIEKGNVVHNGKYIYDKTDYVNSKTDVIITCPIHGNFKQRPNHHLNGSGCPKCAMVHSKAEDELAKFLESLGIERKDKTILNGKEIDIYIPSLKLGIEYNGLHWHNEKFRRDKNYHLNKLNGCHLKNINLIHIFEDEWINHKEICKSKLIEICGIKTDKPIINSNNCTIKENIDSEILFPFVNDNSLEDVQPYSLSLCAFKNDELIAIMTFLNKGNKEWTIVQFVKNICFSYNNIEALLFNYFISKYNFSQITVLCDRRWIGDEKDNIYTRLGFKFDSFITPSYTFYNEKSSKLIRHKTMTEAINAHYIKIYDCGLIKYKII